MFMLESLVVLICEVSKGFSHEAIRAAWMHSGNWSYRRYTDLCVSGLSNAIGPLTLPPLATGVCPVQKTQTYTGGMLLLCSPTQPMCNHL